MKYNPDIIKAYDIRGKYGHDFDDEFAYMLGRALVNYLDARELVISRDERETSDVLSQKLIQGIISTGCHVIDIGKTSTPLFYYGVIDMKSIGGVMVTASHLGPEYSGFKITGNNAVIIGKNSGLDEVLEYMAQDGNQVSKEKGDIIQKSILNKHIQWVTNLCGLSKGAVKQKVKLIGNNMALGELMPVLDTLGIEHVDDGYDIAFEFDPDVDRIIVLNYKGEYIRGDLIGGMIANYYYKGKKIAYDVRYSKGVIEYLESHGLDLVPTRVGHTLIKEVLLEHDLEYGGEGSGHMFFKETGHVESTVLAMLRILRILHETGQTVDELIKPLDTWFNTWEINTRLESRQRANEIIEQAKVKYSDGKLNHMDGIIIDYPDWRFLLRISNTEPMIRLIVDAKTKELMEQKRDELLALIKNGI